MSSKRSSSPASIPEANTKYLYNNNDKYNNSSNDDINNICTVDLGGSGKKFKACIERYEILNSLLYFLILISM